MRSSTFALAVLALAAVASVGDARLMGRALASGPDADGDIEPSQLFMIVCLSIGAFVMLVALIACLLVLKRFGGAATSEPTGPAFAGVPGMAAVGSPYAPMFMPQPMYMQQQQQQMPMQMVPMQMPMQKSAVPMPMPYQQPAQQQQAPSAVQPISAMSRARMNADDHNEVADIHGDNNARVQQMVAEAGAGAGAGADGSSHGFQAHQA